MKSDVRLEDRDLIYWTAIGNKEEVIKYISNFPTDQDRRTQMINGRDDKGIAALHYAVDRGHREIVELLISHGADINLRVTILKFD